MVFILATRRNTKKSFRILNLDAKIVAEQRIKMNIFVNLSLYKNVLKSVYFF